MARGNRRDRSKERFWRQNLRRWRRSGLTVRDFCYEHDLAEPSFYAWRRIIAERDQQARHRRTAQRVRKSQANDTPAFVPVRVLPAATPLSPPPLEVVLAPGRLVRVPAGFDPLTLRQVLAVLEEPSW